MDDSILIVLAIICSGLGLAGSIVPLLPSKPFAFIGLVLFKVISYTTLSWWSVAVAGLILVGLTIFEYVLPTLGTKKKGGSKYSVYGSFIGVILGFVFTPFGFISILILPFLGAFLGELLFTKSNTKHALRIAWGSFLGFIVGSGLSFLYSLIILAYILYQYFDKFNYAIY